MIQSQHAISKHRLGRRNPLGGLRPSELLTEQRQWFKQRRDRIRMKAIRKQWHLDNCSIMAKTQKAMSIIKCQGKNGHSMSAELLRKHGLNPKEKEGE